MPSFAAASFAVYLQKWKIKVNPLLPKLIQNLGVSQCIW